eukprot:TRINITY_DN14970_c0_g1_i1.p1 TRINITY_DN14970_c0_g1~~TRINITY_DN14970_c0_g1_i1.p1  ORF type:complete len:121 (+),score=32.24 TRINITY_DN14970_c0_g1_i1:126-488(+)
MDDWTMYQITGDSSYLNRWRRAKAVKYALMGSSLGAIGVTSVELTKSIADSSSGQAAFPPKGMWRRCGVAAVGLGLAGMVYSWMSTANMVDVFYVQPANATEGAAGGAASGAAGKGKQTL